MEWLRLIGFCLLAAAMVMVLRQLSPAMAGLLAAAFGVLLVGLVLYTQGKDYIFPLVMLGLVEELVCWGIRQKEKQEPENKEE